MILLAATFDPSRRLHLLATVVFAHFWTFDCSFNPFATSTCSRFSQSCAHGRILAPNKKQLVHVIFFGRQHFHNSYILFHKFVVYSKDAHSMRSFERLLGYYNIEICCDENLSESITWRSHLSIFIASSNFYISCRIQGLKKCTKQTDFSTPHRVDRRGPVEHRAFDLIRSISCSADDGSVTFFT